MFKALSSCAFAATIGLTLALGCASGIAQDTDTNDRRPAPEVTSRTDVTPRTDDDGFNYGWLGLAGLLGLLGLMPRSAPQTGFTVRDGAGNVKQQGRT
jgi:hypothetical protein